MVIIILTSSKRGVYNQLIRVLTIYIVHENCCHRENIKDYVEQFSSYVSNNKRETDDLESQVIN